MRVLRRRLTKLQDSFPAIVPPDPMLEALRLAVRELSTEDIETMQGLLLRGGELVPETDAERVALDHYQEAMIAAEKQGGMAA